jgi:alkylation response protein AidB-like acyl-CoA dehydrogenase
MTTALNGLNFQFTEEHLAVQQAARDFAQTELLSGVIERDEKEFFPEELVRKMGEMGFLGMMVSPEYGGGGMDTVSYVLAMEELSKIDASASVMVSVNNSLVCYGLEAFGTEEQKQKYLVPLASGQHIGAFALSEPEAGSDATSAYYCRRYGRLLSAQWYQKLDYQWRSCQYLSGHCTNASRKRT